MKQNYKNYIFSNFNDKWSDAKFEKNALTICESYNINSEQSCIKSATNLKNYFYKKIQDSNKYDMFFNQNKDVLQKICYAVCYEYFDDSVLKTLKRYFVLDVNFELYEMDFYNLTINKIGYIFKSFPKIIKEDGYLYFYDEAGVLVIDGAELPQYYDGVLKLRDYEIIDDNLFFVSDSNPFTIYFCEKTSLINLSDNTNYYNKLELTVPDGEILKILKYKDELYIFQTYKISSYNIYASKNIFSEACFLNTKIIKNTICKLDDKIIFLTLDGLKSFDSNDIKKMFVGLEKQIDFEFDNHFAFVFNGRYYLNSMINLNSKNQNVLFEILCDDEKLNVFKMTSLINNYSIEKNEDEYLLNLCCGDKKRELLTFDLKKPSNSDKYVKFNKIYFDNNEIKQIEKIRFVSRGNFKFKIISDIEECEIDVCEDIVSYNLTIKGHMFEIVLSTSEEFCLESILVEVMTIEDVL